MSTEVAIDDAQFLTQNRGWQDARSLCLTDQIRCVEYASEARDGPYKHVWNDITEVRDFVHANMNHFQTHNVHLAYGNVSVLLHKQPRLTASSASSASVSASSASISSGAASSLEKTTLPSCDHFLLTSVYTNNLAILKDPSTDVFVWNEDLHPLIINSAQSPQELHIAEHKVWAGTGVTWKNASRHNISIPLLRRDADDVPVYALVGKNNS